MFSDTHKAVVRITQNKHGGGCGQGEPSADEPNCSPKLSSEETLCVSSLPCEAPVPELSAPLCVSLAQRRARQSGSHPSRTPPVTGTLRRLLDCRAAYPEKPEHWRIVNPKLPGKRGEGKCCSCSQRALAFQTQKILTECIYCFSHSALGRPEKIKQNIKAFSPENRRENENAIIFSLTSAKALTSTWSGKHFHCP